ASRHTETSVPRGTRGAGSTSRTPGTAERERDGAEAPSLSEVLVGWCQPVKRGRACPPVLVVVLVELDVLVVVVVDDGGGGTSPSSSGSTAEATPPRASLMIAAMPGV